MRLNIMLAVLAAVVLTAFAVLYFVMSGGVPRDPFTVELQDAVAEFKDLTQRFVELHPNPRAERVAALMNEVVDSVAEYNEKLEGQNLERGARASMLAAHLNRTTEKLQPQVDAVTNEMAPEEEMAYYQFFDNNKPRKLFALLGLPVP